MVALGDDQRDPCVQELLLSVKDIQGRSLTHARFFANAYKRAFSGADLFAGSTSLCSDGCQDAPGAAHVRSDFPADKIRIQHALAGDLLGLPNAS